MRGRLRLRRRIKFALVALGIQLTLPFTPRPTIWLMGRVLLLDGAGPSPELARHAPEGVTVLRDEAYGDGPRERFDLHRPADAAGPLPVIVWLHGGGWVGGSKVQSWPYFQVLAAEGYAVVAPEYALAPDHTYPTPVRQMMGLLAHLQAEAERLGLDPDRIVLAGDSAGAQIAAQVAALVTTPGYGRLVGVEPTVAPEQLRGVVLACGPYDLHGIPRSRRRGWTHALFWAYAGTRRYAPVRDRRAFRHVVGRRPPQRTVPSGAADRGRHRPAVPPHRAARRPAARGERPCRRRPARAGERRGP